MSITKDIWHIRQQLSNKNTSDICSKHEVNDPKGATRPPQLNVELGVKTVWKAFNSSSLIRCVIDVSPVVFAAWGIMHCLCGDLIPHRRSHPFLWIQVGWVTHSRHLVNCQTAAAATTTKLRIIVTLHKIHWFLQCLRCSPRWRFGVAVTRWSWSTKLLYNEPG